MQWQPYNAQQQLMYREHQPNSQQPPWQLNSNQHYDPPPNYFTPVQSFYQPPQQQLPPLHPHSSSSNRSDFLEDAAFNRFSASSAAAFEANLLQQAYEKVMRAENATRLMQLKLDMQESRRNK